ncbi:hypothetical protein PSTT_16326 [Puccinia striiformis]|uniref:Uncharacterized protein n=1 Tax=Puccinia striiformis TaxID=27350 RepID=A0A2S4UD99_9BASI|nr:hypothetical protein PSTT_16326 [Puccinia striiformis]
MSDSSDDIYIHSYPPSHSQKIKCASDKKKIIDPTDKPSTCISVSKIASMEKKLNPSKNVIFTQVLCAITFFVILSALSAAWIMNFNGFMLVKKQADFSSPRPMPISIANQDPQLNLGEQKKFTSHDFGTATNIFDSISELEQQVLPINRPRVEDPFQCSKLRAPSGTTPLIPQMISDINLQLLNIQRNLGRVNGKGKQTLHITFWSLLVSKISNQNFLKDSWKNSWTLEEILKRNVEFLSEVDIAFKFTFEFKALLYEHKLYSTSTPTSSWIYAIKHHLFESEHNHLQLKCKVVVSEMVDKTSTFLQDTQMILMAYNSNVESLLEIINTNTSWKDEPQMKLFHTLVVLEMIFKSVIDKGWFNIRKSDSSLPAIGH